MSLIILPAIWLIVLIVGLPQLSETIYTPTLPDIAKALSASESMVEYTLTIFLFGFAIGTFFWGKLSDSYGRKPCMLAGLFIYVIGCISCYYSSSIAMLMISRLIQAFGGSVGSVLGQAICRDAFSGPERGKVYSTVGSAIAFSPAIGPVIGGMMDQAFGWSSIFLLLTFLGIITLILTYFRLPETHHKANRTKVNLISIASKMICDPKIIGFGLIVAGCNGIGFSYYAEGSFYLIDMLGLSPSLYGISFLFIAFAIATGGYLSRKMHDKYSSLEILNKGIWTSLVGTTLFSLFTIILQILEAAPLISIVLTLSSMLVIMTGTGMMIPNALSLALENYQHAIGTASSLFGFSYYILISLFTLVMGLLHNDTLLPMPLYFLGIGIFMLIVYKTLITSSSQRA